MIKIDKLIKALEILKEEGFTDVEELAPSDYRINGIPFWDYIKGPGFIFSIPTEANNRGQPTLSKTVDCKYDRW